MVIFHWFDRTILDFLTQLGGTGQVRDAIVFFLAQVLPFAMIGLGVWLFFRGRTGVQKEQNREIAVIGAGTVAIAIGVRALIAGAFARPRPFVTYPHLHHLNINVSGGTLFPSGHYSFPSGHAFMMFAFAGAIFFLGQHRKL